MLMFSERYSNLIGTDGNQLEDHICGDISYEVKCKIAAVMHHFAEPASIHPNRYNNYEIRTTALDIAVDTFNDKKDVPHIYLEHNVFDGPEYDSLAAAFTPFLFDIIELQYAELSDGEKPEFQRSLNTILNENDTPWLLHEGTMVKIDSIQFEQDLRNKALARMEELKDCDSRFAPAYSELLKAFEFYEKQEYGEAINNAGKSYESVMKVACGVNRGSADKLTQSLIEEISLPAVINPGAFREKVLMSLPYMRNNSTASHGSGDVSVTISREFTHLALNLAAVLDTYVIEEYSRKLSN